MSYSDTILGVNESILDRITNKRRGVSISMTAMAGDFESIQETDYRYRLTFWNSIISILVKDYS